MRGTQQVFFWFPRKLNTQYKVLIDGSDERKRILSASFTKSVAPELGRFKIMVDNNIGYFNGRYSGGEDVELQYDFGSGTTRRFLGTLEETRDDFEEGGHKLELVGSQVGGALLDRSVIASYDGGLSADAVLKDLITNFAPPGFTTANVAASTVFPKIRFNDVPLWKAMSDVNRLAKNFDLYVDDDKDVHFFQQSSVKNDEEAVVMGNNLINLEAIGRNILTVRNKIRVYGESDGMPVVYTAQNVSSQGVYGIKEHVFTNKDITNRDEAKTIADALLARRRNTFEIGGGTSLIQSKLPLIKSAGKNELSNAAVN